MSEESWRDAWEAQAEGWVDVTRADPMYEHINEPAFLELVPPPGRLTLEVGCGEGRMARAASTQATPTRVGVGDAHELPVRDAAADLVVCFMVLMDVDDLDRAVLELSRVLEPGGRCYIAVLHPSAASVAELPELANWARVPDFLHVKAVKLTG